eukprot:TRINITY_DN45169_c0_g1_i1.p1 TRINITY_DN45169_c0_g1~~TRINITY_DN45169_c0_g1_i1.p1  ORF type:complete len:570 (+),score=95.84 TRINITY_DN45169_c0_g1_i1:74-1783(+)
MIHGGDTEQPERASLDLEELGKFGCEQLEDRPTELAAAKKSKRSKRKPQELQVEETIQDAKCHDVAPQQTLEQWWNASGLQQSGSRAAPQSALALGHFVGCGAVNVVATMSLGLNECHQHRSASGFSEPRTEEVGRSDVPSCASAQQPPFACDSQPPMPPKQNSHIVATLSVVPTPLRLQHFAPDLIREQSDKAPSGEMESLPPPTFSADASSAGADEDVSGLPSKGSALHTEGKCKRCAFSVKDRCRNGVDCLYCHMPHERKRKQRHQRLADQLHLPAAGAGKENIQMTSEAVVQVAPLKLPLAALVCEVDTSVTSCSTATPSTQMPTPLSCSSARPDELDSDDSEAEAPLGTAPSFAAYSSSMQGILEVWKTVLAATVKPLPGGFDPEEYVVWVDLPPGVARLGATVCDREADLLAVSSCQIQNDNTIELGRNRWLPDAYPPQEPSRVNLTCCASSFDLQSLPAGPDQAAEVSDLSVARKVQTSSLKSSCPSSLLTAPSAVLSAPTLCAEAHDGSGTDRLRCQPKASLTAQALSTTPNQMFVCDEDKHLLFLHTVDGPIVFYQPEWA